MDRDGKARLDLPALHMLEDNTLPSSESPLVRSLSRSYWPQSYERSMSLYSRSPSSRSLPSPRTGPILALSPGGTLNGSECRRDEAKVALLKGVVGFDQDGADMECSCAHCSDPTQHSMEHLISFSQQEGESSFFQTIVNGANVLAGVGILSMPYAVSQGGWAGLCLLVIFAVVCCYTGILLRRCLDLDPLILGYPDVGQAAFGSWGRILVSSLLYLELFCVAVEFLILEGDNLSQLFPWEGLAVGHVQLSSEQAFLILSALLMLPTVWLRDLSLLSYISAGGLLACLTLLLTVAWVGISESGFTNKGRLLNVQGFPIAVGLYAFCYCGHAVFPNIYGSMKDKSKFTHVLVLCFSLCALTYGGMAVLGFLMYGDAIESQVTLNLPRGELATKVAIFAMLFSPFAKYGLTLTPLAAALEELLPKSWNLAVWGLAIRTLLVSSNVVVALTVPFFAYIMALVGSFLSSSVAITLPCLCYMKLFSGQIPLWERALLFLFLGIGITACVAGTYSSILEIAKELSSD